MQRCYNINMHAEDRPGSCPRISACHRFPTLYKRPDLALLLWVHLVYTGLLCCCSTGVTPPLPPSCSLFTPCTQSAGVSADIIAPPTDRGTMIATVLGPIHKSSVTGSCSAHEHLLQKPSPSDMKAIHDNPITLLSLAEARSGDGGRFAASNRLFSLDESVQEIRSLVDAGGSLVLECSTQREGRDPSGLADISTRTGICIVMAASWARKHMADSNAQEPSAEAIGRELELQLLFGVHVDPTAAVAPSSTSVAATTTGRIQAGFLVVALDDKCNQGAAPPAQAETSGETIRALEGAALAQKATAAPLMVVCSHFVGWELVESAVSVATAHWGDSPAAGKKLILAGMHGGVGQSLPCQVAMLEKGVVLCFDCFGRLEWLPGPEYYPSDEESAVRIAELARLGYADRLVISQGVSRRTHLSRFGGHGYSHALRTVTVRLQRLGVSASNISLMTRGNMLQLLDWYTPPPPVEAPKDYLPCSWCQTRFEPIEGEYFHKFQFVYCGIKCLRLHRDTGFDAARVGGGA